MLHTAVQPSQVPENFQRYPVLPEAAADESFGTACGVACSYPAVRADVLSS